MSDITVNGSETGQALQELLMCPDIEPGDAPGYQICKTLYVYHPLGAKLVDSPIEIAQSQEREISITTGPEGYIKEAFEKEWEAINADIFIAQAAGISRIYGASSVIFGAEGFKPEEIIPPDELYKLDIFFNVLDPLNTSGSMVYNQNPNSPNFQKSQAVQAQGQTYHPSRSCVTFNENPIYLSYTSSAFGYVGRSVYQRALYLMKSFIKSMIADDMVATKAGVLIAKMKQPGGWVDNIMAGALGIKRNLLKEAQNTNVLNIEVDEEIETLNLQNVNHAMKESRMNILNNIATSNGMPAMMLNSETFAEGFGEGTEDAKVVARYIHRFRNRLGPLYRYFDRICMHRAWNPEFYKTVQKLFPEYKNVSYAEAFYQWKNSFKAVWPSLLIEPDSERSKNEKVKLESIIELVSTLMPHCDPENRVRIMQFAADNFNNQKLLFQNPLILDFDALREYEPDPDEGDGENEDDGTDKKPKPVKLKAV